MPFDTNYDRLLCAVYQHVFFGGEEPMQVSPFASTSPPAELASMAMVAAGLPVQT